MLSNLKPRTEVNIDVALVSQLLNVQFPQWADLPVKLVDPAGTDNALYRLGEDMVVRLPRNNSAIKQVEKEQFWLPKLAAHLPLTIPTPLEMGIPTKDYPWHWSIYKWIEGQNANTKRINDLNSTAMLLAQFITTLQQTNTTDGPPAGEHNFFRGVPLVNQDPFVRDAIRGLQGMIDIDTATMAWEAALQAPKWHGSPVWLHGDLHAGNLLVRQGQLSAVIDFGGLGVGDPACDLMVAWTFLSRKSRDVFRAAVQVDDATWARGRGWALSFGLIALPYYYYYQSNPAIEAAATHAIDGVLANYKRGA